MPSADYLIRILDGRIEAKGTPDELRAAGELEGLIALEKAEAVKEEPVVTAEDVEQEVEAVEGEPKKDKKKGPGRKLVQGQILPLALGIAIADPQTKNDLSATSNGRRMRSTSSRPLTSHGSLPLSFLVRADKIY